VRLEVIEMKKFFLCIVIALFSVTAFGSFPSDAAVVYAQKKGEDRGKEKKDPPGPPVVKEKERPKNPPKDKPKGKKPPDR
jgi:hypothetical protein